MNGVRLFVERLLNMSISERSNSGYVLSSVGRTEDYYDIEVLYWRFGGVSYFSPTAVSKIFTLFLYVGGSVLIKLRRCKIIYYYLLEAEGII